MRKRIRKTELSIVIPCYNEGYIIKETVGKILSQMSTDYRVEIILVNDGSVDNTTDMMCDLLTKFPGIVKMITYSGNKGKGHAVHKGLLIAKYETIMLLDADLSVYPFHYKYFKKGSKGRMPKYYIIQGQRYQSVPQPLYRILVGKIWKILVWGRSGLWMDTQSPYKVLKLPLELYEELSIDGFAFDVELLYKAKKRGIKIFKQDVFYFNNIKTSVTIRKTWEMFKDLIKLC